MSAFGFSAYLKLLSSTPRRQRSIIRERIVPRGSGYDFHRSLRAHAGRLLIRDEPYEEVIRSLRDIVRVPERNSARYALARLQAWREVNPGQIYEVPSVTFESPNGLFRVRYNPDFAMFLDGRLTAVHLWNTANPELEARAVFGSLSVLPELYATVNNAPEDLSVLSLRNSRLFRLSDAPDFSLIGRRSAEAIEKLFGEVRDELGLPALERGERPSAPPSPS